MNDADPAQVQERLQKQGIVYEQLNGGAVSMLIGQALEIAVFRALAGQMALQSYGGFLDLDDHDDSTLYSKEEHPSLLSGHRMPGDKKLDFLLYHPEAGH